MRTILRWALAIPFALSALSVGTARGEDRYYAMIFGSQSSSKLLRYTHTWATFVRVVGEGDDPRGYQVYPHTISWLPETLSIRGQPGPLRHARRRLPQRRERDDVGPLRDGPSGL
jgi:hypothetical protein